MTEIFSERIFPLWTDGFFGRGGSDYAQQPTARAGGAVSHANSLIHPLDPGDIIWGTEKPEDDGDKVTAWYRFNLAEPSNETNGPQNTPDFGDKILSSKIVFVADSVNEVAFDSHIFCAARDGRWDGFDGTGASANPIFNNRGFHSYDVNATNFRVNGPLGGLIDGPGSTSAFADDLFHDMATTLSFGVQRMGFSFRVTSELPTVGSVRVTMTRVGGLTGKFAFCQIFESEFHDGVNDAPAEGAVEIARSDGVDMGSIVVNARFVFPTNPTLDPTKRYAAIVTTEGTDVNNHMRFVTRANIASGVQSQVIAMAVNQVAPNNASYLNSGINTTNYFDNFQYPHAIGDDGRDLPGTLRAAGIGEPGGVDELWPQTLAGPIIRDTPGFAVIDDEYEMDTAELIQELVQNPLWSGGASGPDPQILLIGIATKFETSSAFRAAKVARLHVSWLHHDQVCGDATAGRTQRATAIANSSRRATASAGRSQRATVSGAGRIQRGKAISGRVQRGTAIAGVCEE